MKRPGKSSWDSNRYVPTLYLSSMKEERQADYKIAGIGTFFDLGIL